MKLFTFCKKNSLLLADGVFWDMSPNDSEFSISFHLPLLPFVQSAQNVSKLKQIVLHHKVKSTIDCIYTYIYICTLYIHVYEVPLGMNVVVRFHYSEIR